MSTLKVNYIQANTTSEIDINSPLGTIPSLDVTGSATIGGNLNITGVSTFSNSIVVSAGFTAAPSISPSGDSNTGIFFPEPDTVAIGEGGSEVLRVNSSGYVGINTNNPQKLIEVGAANTTSKFQLNPHSAGWDLAATSGNIAPHYQTNISLYTGQIGSGTLRWRIDSSGRVTIPYQPFFYARPTTSGDGQTANPYTFANVIHNVGNHFVTSGTGAYQRFVAPIDGVYCFQSNPGYKQTSVDWSVRVRVNGTEYAEIGRFIGALNSHSTVAGSVTIKLSTNDYVDLVTTSTPYHHNTTLNFFCGYLLG